MSSKQVYSEGFAPVDSEGFAPVDSEPGAGSSLADFYLTDREDSTADYNALLREQSGDYLNLDSPQATDTGLVSPALEGITTFYDGFEHPVTEDSFSLRDTEDDVATEHESFGEIPLTRTFDLADSLKEEDDRDSVSYLEQSLIDSAPEMPASSFDSSLSAYLASPGTLTVYTRAEEQEATREYKHLGEVLLENLCKHDVFLERIVSELETIAADQKHTNKLFMIGKQDKEGQRSVLKALHGLPEIRKKLDVNRMTVDFYASADAAEVMPSEISLTLVENRAAIAAFLRKLPVRVPVIRSLANEFLDYAAFELNRLREAEDCELPELHRCHLQGDSHLGIVASQVEAVSTRHAAVRSEIAKHNYRLVMAVIKTLKIGRVEIDDQFQEGVNGLLRSIDVFKPELGYKLSTSAWHSIQRSILAKAGTASKVGPVSLYTHKLLQQLHAVEGVLTSELGRSPSVSELAERLEMKESRVRALVEISAALNGSFSIDQIYGTDGEESQFDLADRTKGTGAGVDRDTIDQIFALGRKYLDQRSFDMLERFYRHGETQAKIAKVYRVTRQRVQDLLAEAVKKVRYHVTRGEKIEARSTDAADATERKDSHLFDLFYKAATLPAQERPEASMKTLELYAGDVNFWHCFMGSNENYIKFFRARLASSERGFDLSQLSRERQEIFQQYLDERVPDLSAVQKSSDRAFATLLCCPRNTLDIQRAMVEQGWRSEQLPEGAPLSIGQNYPSPYVNPEVLPREQIVMNIDRFIAQNYSSLEEFHSKGPGMKMIIRVLGDEMASAEKLAAYAAREEGPLSRQMPLSLPAMRARHPSFYFRPEIVGQYSAFLNAGRWVRHNIGSLHLVKPNLRVLRSILNVTDFSPDAAPDRFKMVVDAGAELVRRGWVDPQLPLAGHGVQTTRHMAANVTVTGSAAIADWNKAHILGRPLPELPAGENKFRIIYGTE